MLTGSYDLKTFKLQSADISISNGFTFKLSSPSTRWTSFTAYNQTVYGFTYNTDSATPKFVDMLVYNQTTDLLLIKKMDKAATCSQEYYKIINKDYKIIEDLANGLGVYMTSVETATDNFFDIYIAANTQNPEDKFDRDFYIAKFSTLYNITEWYKHSKQSGLNETVRGIHYDSDNQIVYLAVEVNTNSYLGATSYSTFSEITFKNQSNIAIIAYDRYFGNRRYVQLLGEPKFNDTLTNMGSLGNNFYALITTYDQPSNYAERTWNLQLYEIRQDTGLINQRLRIGSIGLQDEGIDMQVTQKGIYILAKIGNYLCADNKCSKSDQWDTDFSYVHSFGIIFIKYSLTSTNLEIVEVDSKGASWLLRQLGFLPSRMFIANTDQKSKGNDYQFIFVGQRDDYSGLYYTVFQNNNQAFQTSSSCDSNCQYCNYQDRSYCLQCDSSYYWQLGTCKSSVSIGYFGKIDSLSGLKYNQKCHITCTTCSQFPDCTSCTAPFILSSSQCICANNENQGNCLTSTNQIPCDQRSTAIMNKRCSLMCPENSYKFYDFEGATAQLRSEKRASVSIKSALRLKTFSEKANLALNVSSNITSLPTDFTFSFWVIKKDDSSGSNMQKSYDVLNAFGRLYFMANYSSSTSKHQLSCKFVTNSFGTFIQLPAPLVSNLDINKWYKVTISVKSNIASTFNFYLNIFDFSDNSNSDSLLTNQNDFYQNPFNNKIYLGIVTLPSNNLVFPGSLREIVFMSVFKSLTQIKQDAFRTFRGYGFDTQTILAYYPLSNETVDPNVIYAQFNDHSQYPAEPTIIYTSQVTSSTPIFQIINTLDLDVWDDLATCKAPKVTISQLDRATMRGDFLQTKLEAIQTFYGQLIAETTDRINICEDDCSCKSGVKGRFQVISTSPMKLNGNTNFPPLNVQQGKHYQVCYQKNSQSETFSVPLGQIYILDPIKYVYPFNRGVYKKVDTTFLAQGGDIAYQDELVFSVDTDCDYAESDASKITFTRQDTYTFDQQKFNSDHYLMCWRHAIVAGSGSSHYIQVNNFNYWKGVGDVTFSDNKSPTSVNLQERYLSYNLKDENFLPGDVFKVYSASTFEDCYMPNKLGLQMSFWNIRANGSPFFSPLWFGTNIGITRITSTTNLLHICYHSFADQADTSGYRVSNYDSSAYELTVNNVPPNSKNLPEISHWFVNYSGTVNNSVNVSFAVYPYPSRTNAYQVYPAQHPTQNYKGKIEIRRMAIDQSGDIVETQEVLWKKDDLTHSNLKTTQGDLQCQSFGICSINITSLVAGEIYTVIMYTYSFLIKSSGNDYYLFGSSVSNVQAVYKHLFFVRGWTIDNRNPQLVSYETSYLEFTGRNLLYMNNTRVRAVMTSNVNEANFTTQAINMTFQVKNSIGCSIKRPPFGTILQEDIQNDKFVIRDMNYNGCQNGTLFANIYLWRGIKNPQTGKFNNIFVSNYLDYYVGKFGCDPACLRCNGTSSSNCLLCANSSTTFLHQGQCLNSCPDSSPFFTTYTMVFNSNYINGQRCIESCPEGTFPNYLERSLFGAVPCESCFSNCQQCSDNYPEQCERCMPIRYNFKGICLEYCPDNDMEGVINENDWSYTPNYSNYTCQPSSAAAASNSTDILKVDFVPLGYRRKIPKDQIVFFKAAISTTLGDVKQVFWKQIEPSANISDYSGTSYWSKSEIKNKFIFDGITTMSQSTQYLTTSYAFQKLRMSSFNYFIDTQIFRVIVKAENTKNNMNIDIMEFGINDPPKSKDLLIFTSDYYHNYTMKTIFNITTVNQSSNSTQKGWYDSIEDSKQLLSFKLYLDTGDQRFLIKPLTYQMETFTFKAPFIASSYVYQQVDFYVMCQDKYAATAYKYLSVNLTNTYSQDQRLAYLKELSKLMSNDSLANTQNQLMIANFMEIAFEEPRTLMTGGVKCMIDYHCFNNGRCTQEYSGIPECICQDGYIGNFCQTKVDEFMIAKDLTNATFAQIKSYFRLHVSADKYLNGDLEYLVMLTKGLVKNYETVTLDQIYLSLSFMKTCIDAHIEVVYTYTKAFQDDFFDLMSRILGRIHYEKLILETDYNLKLDYVSARILAMKDLVDLYDYVNNEFIRILLLKMNKQINYDYAYQTTYLSVHLSRKQSQELLNNTRNGLPTIFKLDENSQTDVQIRAPPGFADNLPQVNQVSDLRIKFVKYVANPYVYKKDLNKLIESPIIVFEIMDELTRKIDAKLSDYKVQKDGFIQISMPYSEMKHYEPEYLKCKWYDQVSDTFKSDGCGLQIYSPSSCINCSTSIKQAVCFCSHLSTFALVFEPTDSNLGNKTKLGIYTDFYGMDYWKESFGFIAVLGATAFYFLGLILSIIFDIRPQKLMKHKLLRDFRNIDRYGLNNDNDDKKDHFSLNETSTNKKQGSKKGELGPLEELKDFEPVHDEIDYGKKGHKGMVSGSEKQEAKGKKIKKGMVDSDNLSIFDLENKKKSAAVSQAPTKKKQDTSKQSKQQKKAKKGMQDEDQVEQLDIDQDASQSYIQDRSHIQLNKGSLKREERKNTPDSKANEQMEVEEINEDNKERILFEGGDSDQEDQIKKQSQNPQNQPTELDEFEGQFKKVKGKKKKRGGTQQNFNQNFGDSTGNKGITSTSGFFGGASKNKTGFKSQKKDLEYDLQTNFDDIGNNQIQSQKKRNKQPELIEEIDDDIVSQVESMAKTGFSIKSTSKKVKKANKKQNKQQQVRAIQEEHDENKEESHWGQLKTPSENSSEHDHGQKLLNNPQSNNSETSKSSSSPEHAANVETRHDSYSSSPQKLIKQESPKSIPETPKGILKQNSKKIKDSDLVFEEELKSDEDKLGFEGDLQAYEMKSKKPVKNHQSQAKKTKGSSSNTVYDESGDSKEGTRPSSKHYQGKPSNGNGVRIEVTKASEITQQDDPDNRFLRYTEYKSVEEEIRDLAKTKEERMYTLLNIIKYGNPILNLIFVDSLLFPRHARWTLLFMNIILIWFFCAVIYNNTKSPLELPDTSREASSLALNDLWIALIAPGGNIILMYLFSALFRITDQRIKYSADLQTLKEMLVELRKEMALRFIMAYFIALAVFAAVFWYVVQFTSTFGWKVSWAWWYSGCIAAILHFVGYDLVISMIHWGIYRIWKRLGVAIGNFRQIKQGVEES